LTQSVRNLPIGLYGAVMGLAGLGLALRAAAPLFPGVVRAPAYLSEPWVLAAALALAVLLPAYVWKLVRYPAAVRSEFSAPSQMGFCAALPLGMTLVAGGLAPYAAGLADVLWWIGVILLLAFQAWGLARILEGGIELAELNGGWMILFVGGIVVPGSGITLGHHEVSRFMFGIGATATPLVMGLLLYRAAVGPALPERMRPSWFILLVAPALVYAHGTAFYADFAFVESLFFFGLLLAVALLVYARGLLHWPFGAPWWAFTFPLDAFSYAATRYAQNHPSGLWKGVAAAALLVATLFVAVALVKTLAALARGELLAPAATARSAASPAA
jgi:tellurite resistance protein